jgi:hypothetical protein
MLITLVLFIAALFYKGFTHDLLIESAVFLVSVKIIIGTYKNKVTSIEIKNKLENIHTDIIRLNNKNSA